MRGNNQLEFIITYYSKDWASFFCAGCGREVVNSLFRHSATQNWAQNALPFPLFGHLAVHQRIFLSLAPPQMNTEGIYETETPLSCLFCNYFSYRARPQFRHSPKQRVFHHHGQLHVHGAGGKLNILRYFFLLSRDLGMHQLCTDLQLYACLN